MWSYKFQPAYELMLQANNFWQAGIVPLKMDYRYRMGKWKVVPLHESLNQGDLLFLQACALMYPISEWKHESPVSELVDWAIDDIHWGRVQKLHMLTDFEQINGFEYYYDIYA